MKPDYFERKITTTAGRTDGRDERARAQTRYNTHGRSPCNKHTDARSPLARTPHKRTYVRARNTRSHAHHLALPTTAAAAAAQPVDPYRIAVARRSVRFRSVPANVCSPRVAFAAEPVINGDATLSFLSTHRTVQTLQSTRIPIDS